MTFPYKGFILSWLLRHWQKSSGKAELKNELLRYAGMRSIQRAQVFEVKNSDKFVEKKVAGI